MCITFLSFVSDARSATAGGYIEAGLPEIYGYLQNWGDRGDSFQYVAGCFKVRQLDRSYYCIKAEYCERGDSTHIQYPIADFYASLSSAVY